MCKRIFSYQTHPIGDVPFYKIGTIGNKADSYISKELFNEYREKYNYPCLNEVMITCAGTVGKCWQFNGEPSYYQDSNIVWISNPSGKIINSFIYRILSITNWDKLNSTTITRIYNDNLKNLRCLFPTYFEQKKITDFLTLLDQRIEKQRDLVESLKKYKRGVFIKLYQQFEKRKYKIKDLGKYKNTGNLSKDDIVENGKYPCILYGELFTKYNETVEQIYSNTNVIPTHLSKGNELLFPSSTTVDALSLISPSSIKLKNIFLGGDMFVIRLSNHFDSDFLSYLVNYFYKKQLARYAQGITIIHLHYSDIKELELSIPDLSWQKQIASVIIKCESFLQSNNKILKRLIVMKKGLLQQMFI